MTRVFSAIRLPVLLPLRLARSWLRGRVRGGLWSKANVQAAVHEVALFVGPPAAAVGAWMLYAASGWGPRGAGGDVRCAVLAWLAAGLVVLAVHGARRGDAAGRAEVAGRGVVAGRGDAADDGHVSDEPAHAVAEDPAPGDLLAGHPVPGHRALGRPAPEDPSPEPPAPAHPGRYAAGYALVFSLYLVVVLTLVLLPVALILSV
jgi:hypothetical protein